MGQSLNPCLDSSTTSHQCLSVPREHSLIFPSPPAANWHESCYGACESCYGDSHSSDSSILTPFIRLLIISMHTVSMHTVSIPLIRSTFIRTPSIRTLTLRMHTVLSHIMCTLAILFHAVGVGAFLAGAVSIPTWNSPNFSKILNTIFLRTPTAIIEFLPEQPTSVY